MKIPDRSFFGESIITTTIIPTGDGLVGVQPNSFLSSRNSFTPIGDGMRNPFTAPRRSTTTLRVPTRGISMDLPRPNRSFGTITGLTIRIPTSPRNCVKRNAKAISNAPTPFTASTHKPVILNTANFTLIRCRVYPRHLVRGEIWFITK